MIATWAGRYVGIPYTGKGRDLAGLDCLGLLYLIYKNDLGIDLPDYDNYNHADNKTIEGVFNAGIDEWMRIPNAEPGALVMLTIGGLTTHLGICIGDNKFIHCMDGVDCTIDRLDSLRWDKRIEGFYKWIK